MDGTARADGARASVNPCRDWRTTAICAARANSSPTSACRHARSGVRAQPCRACAHSIRAQAAGAEAAVFIAADLTGVQPIVAVSGLPGFKPSVQPVLATDKVRHVGEAIAVCVAGHRAAGRGPRRRRRDRLRRIAGGGGHAMRHSPAKPECTSTGATTTFWRHSSRSHRNDFAQPVADRVRRRLRTARQCMSPLEGRGVVATWDRRLEQLLIYTSTQLPHIVRTGLAGCLGLDQARVRVVAPDVGGGFGYKGILLPEEVCAGSSRACSAIPCAGSRIGANSSPATPIVVSTTTTSRCTPKPTAR